MADEPYEVVDLIVAIDPGIAGRMLAAHPPDGYCRSCRTSAPCSSRTLAEAVSRRLAELAR